MHKILLENMVFHAKHGFFEEENIIGGKFELNLELETDFNRGLSEDDLSGTVDYSAIYDLVANEMKQPSKLLEHLGGRIIDGIYKNFPSVQFIKLKISKLSPPISGEIEKVSIVIEE